MKLLLDTHILLWAMAGDERMRPAARRAITDSANTVYVSAASAWEIAIKAGLGRVRIPPNTSKWLPAEIERSQFLALPVTIDHALAVERLPRHHNDPFDRLLVAQAKADGLTLVTHDRNLCRYDIAVLEA
ncbi:MAG: type II toxin-antitoxin system VapC family toxin [Candidatus Coatesbacteria bacterium]